jgi:hypothetical protein
LWCADLLAHLFARCSG